jgi:ectoine hydroxylase-related dioxygenase (phytanoyl-CoA dioxygenase family)
VISYEIEADGFEIVTNCLTATETDRLLSAVEAAQNKQCCERKSGLRNLLRLGPVAELAYSTKVLCHVQRTLGPNAFPARALLFDKTPDANWKLTWHQDKAIALKSAVEAPGFGPWSVKDGVPHAHAPSAILERMVSVRIHLDDCPAENGALQVIRSSHLHGRLSAEEISQWELRGEKVTCEIHKGGLLLLRPLLLHSSLRSTGSAHRRIVQIEYAADALPGGLEWYESSGNPKS